MLRASALYMVIIISLIVALLCSSIIAAAFFYRLQTQDYFRSKELENSLVSGNNIILASDDASLLKPVNFSLFGEIADSVTLQKIQWGIYDIGITKSYIQKDTLFDVFSIANSIDSSKWAVLYLTDEDRPLNLSGQTTIIGNAFIPKAGIKSTYFNNQNYTGNKKLIAGKTSNSLALLPPLSSSRLNYLELQLKSFPQADSALLNKGSVVNSFLSPTVAFRLKKNTNLEDINLSGNIIIYADSTLTIENTAQLNHVIVFAKDIIVKDGFSGNCQLFALDSISIGKNCKFSFPSCLGTLRLQSSTLSLAEQIHLGNGTIFNGSIFIFEAVHNNLKPLIEFSKNVRIIGQIYIDGLVTFNDGDEVDGSIFADRFIYRTSITVFEDYLINIKLDALALSSFYLTSDLLPVSSGKRKILEWLEKN